VRKVTFGGANGLDNCLARPDHAVGWLLWGGEAAAVTADYRRTIDTALTGRKTYAVALRGGRGGGYHPTEGTGRSQVARRPPPRRDDRDVAGCPR
jgi:hypothetical protein